MSGYNILTLFFVLAFAEHLKDLRVIANKAALKAILSGEKISDEKFANLVNDVQSEEMRYKRNAFFCHVPKELDKLDQQGKQEERKLFESNLVDMVKEEIFDHVVLQRKSTRALEGRSTDHEVVMQEDKHFICEKFEQTVDLVEQGIEGGLRSLAYAGNKMAEVVQDVVVGNIEQASRTLHEQAILRAQPTLNDRQQQELEKQKEVEENDEIKEQTEVATKGSNKEERVITTQAEGDEEAERAALKAKRALKKQTNSMVDTLNSTNESRDYHVPVHGFHPRNKPDNSRTP